MRGEMKGDDSETYPHAFLDEKEGTLIHRIPWLSPRRLAFFVIFWVTIFYVGAIFVNNPFRGGPGTTGWAIGAASSNYYWVVMYLHGLNTGLVGLAALVACDLLELPSRHARKLILGGVLAAGLLSPIGALFNTSAPWTGAGLWVQVAAFLALDEVLIAFLWGMLGVWRAGEPRSRTFPFIAVGLTGLTMLLAAVMGHVAGTILGFGNNPSVLGWYATVQNGETLNTFAFNLISAHAYLMTTALPAGILSLVAIRWGYYRLKAGWVKRLAQMGFALICLDLMAQMGFALMMGLATYPGDLPPSIASLSLVPSYVMLNDGVNFGGLIFGGSILMVALLIGSGRLKEWSHPSGIPLRAVPLITLVMFGIVTAVTEPSSMSSIGTPQSTWIRLFIAFFLTMAIAIVILVAERLLPSLQQIRIGWLMMTGSLLIFVGVLNSPWTNFASTSSPVGGYLMVTGLVVVGATFLLTVWQGWTSTQRSSGLIDPLVATSLSPRRAVIVLASIAVPALLLVAAVGGPFHPPVSQSTSSGGMSMPAVQYVNSTVGPVASGGIDVFSPGNFTVMSNATVVFTFTVTDTDTSAVTPAFSVVQGALNGTEEVISSPGASPTYVSSLPNETISHVFTIAFGATVINAPLPAAAAATAPVTVVFPVVFTHSGTYTWYCCPYCRSFRIQPGDGMAGSFVVT